MESPAFHLGVQPRRADVKQLTRPQHRHQTDHGQPPSSQSAPAPLPRGVWTRSQGGKRMASAPPAAQTGHCQSCHSPWTHSQAALGGGSRRGDSCPRSAEAQPSSTHSTAHGLQWGGRAGSWQLGSSAAPLGLHCSPRTPTSRPPFKALGTLKMSRRGEDLLPRPAVHLQAGVGLC